jgi:hypothetical protein
VSTVRSAAATFIAFVLAAAVGDVVSEEVRTRLDRLPVALLKVVLRILPSDDRDRWLGEGEDDLQEVLRGTEAMPITRLWRAGKYAAGRFWAAVGLLSILAALTARLVGLATAAMFNGGVRTRLDRLPFALFKLAMLIMPAEARDRWLPEGEGELCEIGHYYADRAPIVRLGKAVRYSVGWFKVSVEIRREASRIHSESGRRRLNRVLGTGFRQLVPRLVTWSGVVLMGVAYHALPGGWVGVLGGAGAFLAFLLNCALASRLVWRLQIAPRQQGTS